MLARTIPISVRVRKRFPVRFGPPSAPFATVGFSSYLATTEVAFQARTLYPPGTKLQFELQLAEGVSYEGVGLVESAQQGLHQNGSMNVRLLKVDERYFEFLANLSGADLPAASTADAEPEVETTPPPGASEAVLTSVLVPPPGDLQPVEESSDRTWFAAPDNDEEDARPTSASKSLVERPARFAAGLPIRFGAGVALDAKGSTLNLSRTGLAFAGTAPLRPGEMFAFAITSEGGIARGVGKVVWTRVSEHQRWRATMGVRFTYNDPAYQQLLEELSRWD